MFHFVPMCLYIMSILISTCLICQAAESKLAKFVEDIIVPPRMIDIIVDGEVLKAFLLCPPHHPVFLTLIFSGCIGIYLSFHVFSLNDN